MTELVRLSFCYGPDTCSYHVVVWPYFMGFFTCFQLRVASCNNTLVLNRCESSALFRFHDDIGHSFPSPDALMIIRKYIPVLGIVKGWHHVSRRASALAVAPHDCLVMQVLQCWTRNLHQSSNYRSLSYAPADIRRLISARNRGPWPCSCFSSR